MSSSLLVVAVHQLPRWSCGMPNSVCIALTCYSRDVMQKWALASLGWHNGCMTLGRGGGCPQLLSSWQDRNSDNYTRPSGCSVCLLKANENKQTNNNNKKTDEYSHYSWCRILLRLGETTVLVHYKSKATHCELPACQVQKFCLESEYWSNHLN